MKKTTVMVFGAFDGLHPGHLNFFKQAKKYGDFLIVSVAQDVNVEKIKGRPPLFNQKERLELIRECKLVNLAVLGAKKDFYKHIARYKPEAICLGYDQWPTISEVKSGLEKVALGKTKVIRLAPFKAKIAKSTVLKNRSVEFNN